MVLGPLLMEGVGPLGILGIMFLLSDGEFTSAALLAFALFGSYLLATRLGDSSRLRSVTPAQSSVARRITYVVTITSVAVGLAVFLLKR